MNLPYEPVFLVNTVNRHMPCFEGHACETVEAAFLSLKELTSLPRVLKMLKADLYHSPSFSSLWSSPCPHTVTIHDLNHLRFGGLAKKVYYRVLLKRFAIRAEIITTVSDFSKKEISRWLKGCAKEIRVVMNSIHLPGVNAANAAQTLKKRQLVADGFFFALANDKPHKNQAMLIEAYTLYLLSKELLPRGPCHPKSCHSLCTPAVHFYSLRFTKVLADPRLKQP